MDTIELSDDSRPSSLHAVEEIDEFRAIPNFDFVASSAVSEKERQIDREPYLVCLSSDDSSDGARPAKRARFPNESEETPCLLSPNSSPRSVIEETYPLKVLAVDNAFIKRDAEREEVLARATSENHKSLRPGECMKHMRVKSGRGSALGIAWMQLETVLQAAGAVLVPDDMGEDQTILQWERRCPRYLLEHCGQMGMSAELQLEPHALLLVGVEEVRQIPCRLQQLRARFPTSLQITLLLYGSKDYLRKLKNKKNANWKKQVGGESSRNTGHAAPQMTENDLDYYLTKLLVEERTSCTRADTSEELAQTVLQFTKAIAEAPYKKSKNAHEDSADFYMRGDNKDCVRVDKNGGGLLRLWSQSLTRFPLAGLEVAQAVAQRFPSPAALMQMLLKESEEKAVGILADIPVRRAATPLASARRLGPEVSRKIVHFFTATRGDESLS